MPSHAPKMQKDDIARCNAIATAFPDFTAVELTAPKVTDFLEQFDDKPRTYSAYQEMVRELMR